MKSSVIKRSLTLNNRRVRVSMEYLFWVALEEIANARATTTSSLLASIDAARDGAELSSTIRAYVLHHFQNRMRGLDEVDEPPSRAARRPAGDDQTDDDRPRWLN